ncbi:MAG TPA: DUF4157 domain-containing protein, partial [Polyangia bacterium]|nr:DUF4157 domain-containing protein [Polyangia bacterium]
MRSHYERCFGQDFSSVKVDTGAEGKRVTRAAGAVGLTVGDHVWLGEDRRARLPLVLGHELAHVVQQRRGGAAPSPHGAAAHETEASRASVGAALGRPVSVAAATGVGPSRVTLEELERMLKAAIDQWHAEPAHKRGPGATGEGAYRANLSGRGAPNVDFNEFTPGTPNAPHLDVVSNEGVAQVKVHGTPAADGAPAGTPDPALKASAVGSYAKDLRSLSAPEFIIGGEDRAQKAAELLLDNRASLEGKSAWPAALKNINPADPRAKQLEQVLEYFRRESVLAVPNDQVDAVRAKVIADARAQPAKYGLQDGPNLEDDVQALARRVQPIGLKLKPLSTISSDLHAGKTPTVDDLTSEAAPEPPKQVAAPPKPATGEPAPAAGEPPSVVNAKPPVVEAKPPVVEAKPPAVETKPPAVENQPPVGEDAGIAPKPASAKPAAPGEPAPAPEAPGLLGRLAPALKWGGRALAVYGGYSEYRRLRAEGNDVTESLLGGIGMGGGFLAGPSLLKNAKGAGAVDLAINLANLGLHAAGAPQGVTDVSSTVASATPSSFIGSVVSQGARAYLNIAKAVAGDASGIDKQVKGMQEGKAGAPLQGYGLVTEFLTQWASTGSAEQAVMKAGSIGQGSSAARIGNSAGDSWYVNIQFAKNLKNGDSLDTALSKLPHLSKDTKWIEDTGNKIGDVTYNFANKDVPAAVNAVKKEIETVKATVEGKVETVKATVEEKIDEAKQVVSDTVDAAADKGIE